MTSKSRHARRRGFTLVELMVSLVAGLIIAIAVVSLARAATTAFYEQVRLTTVEQSVRSAANRLRYDLTKVSFMGTGNIQLAKMDGVPYGHRAAVNANGQAGERYGTATRDLQGIRILVGQSKAATEGSATLATNNGLNPDEIIITGNLTTDDQYVGTWNDAAGSCGGGQVTLPATADPANARLLNNAPDAATAAANVANAFTPIASRLFLARVVDDGGCQHFVTVQNAGATAANVGAVNLCLAPADNASVLLASTQDPTDVRKARPVGCGVTPNTGTVRISPLHRVRWYLGVNTNPLLAPPTGIGNAADQFMLYRQLLDANGAAAGSPQIVSEYAVDLKFGIVVDDPSAVAPNNIRAFDLDSDSGPVGGGGNIDAWTQPASLTFTGRPGPQRVRSVKYRVSTRTSLPDRTANLSVLPGTPYITRYCIENATPASCTKFARVRTLVSEVALINQARMTY